MSKEFIIEYNIFRLYIEKNAFSSSFSSREFISKNSKISLTKYNNFQAVREIFQKSYSNKKLNQLKLPPSLQSLAYKRL